MVRIFDISSFLFIVVVDLSCGLEIVSWLCNSSLLQTVQFDVPMLPKVTAVFLFIICNYVSSFSCLIDLKGTLRDLSKAGRITFEQNELVIITFIYVYILLL